MTLYLQSHRRKPVRNWPLLPWEDIQGAVPAGWCCRCGGEIYLPGRLICDHCEKGE